MSQAKQVTDPIAGHGEGPVYSASWSALRWVDLFKGDVLNLSDTGKLSRDHISKVVAALRPRSVGGTIYATERGFLLENSDGTRTTLPDLWHDESIRFNDGGCDPQGRFYCGTMTYSEEPGAGKLYRLDPQGKTETILENVTVSNGFAFNPAGNLAYYIDSPTGTIDVFDYDGTLKNRRPFARITVEDAAPDGLTVDANGNVWTALWGGGAVHAYDPQGRLQEVLQLPAPRTTACTFGGPNLDTLYVTTSQVNTDLEKYPLAGALFSYLPGTTGQPTLEYGA
jgi:sugar lactone lactonase YvrE